MNNSIGRDIADEIDEYFVRSLLREIENIFEFWVFDNLSYLVRRRDLIDLRKFYDRKEYDKFSGVLNALSIEFTRDNNAEKVFLGDRETVVFNSTIAHSFDGRYKIGYDVSCTRFISYNQEIQTCSEEYIKNAKKKLK